MLCPVKKPWYANFPVCGAKVPCGSAFLIALLPVLLENHGHDILSTCIWLSVFLLCFCVHIVPGEKRNFYTAPLALCSICLFHLFWTSKMSNSVGEMPAFVSMQEKIAVTFLCTLTDNNPLQTYRAKKLPPQFNRHVGMDLWNVQKQGTDENTRRLLYYGNMAQKRQEGYLYLLHTTVSYATNVFFLSLYSTMFCNRVVVLCFHPCLVSQSFTGLSLHVIIFSEHLYPYFLLFFGAEWGEGLKPNSEKMISTLPPPSTQTAHFSVLEALPPSKFPLIKEVFLFSSVTFHIWLYYVHALG